MEKQKKSHEIKGRGYDSLREFCTDLRDKLNAEGFNLSSELNSEYVDGMSVTDNHAFGLVYLLNSADKNNGVEISVVSDESAVKEGESFLDYGFSKATIKPYGIVDNERLKSGLVEVLYEQMRRNFFENKKVLA